MSDFQEELKQLAPHSAAVKLWSRLVSGDVRLAVTFWVFYVGMFFAWNLGIEILSLTAVVQSGAAFALLELVLLIYAVPVTVGVFRAANKYTGRQPLWPLYAKVLSVLGLMVTAVLALLVAAI